MQDVQQNEIAMIKDSIAKDKEYDDIHKQREQKYIELIQRLEADNRWLQSENAEHRRKLSQHEEAVSEEDDSDNVSEEDNSEKEQSEENEDSDNDIEINFNI